MAEEFQPRKNRALAICCAVFLLAVVLRIPSCGESFWVDELHTAWVIADEFSLVSQRAEIGNQTPWYFWGQWSWSRLAGTSEVALRFPSVIAVALASSMLAWCGWRISNSLTVATLAGVFLAVEQNSLYFGTEARAYSFVTLAVAGWVTCASEAPVSLQRRGIWLAGTGLCAAAAVLMHVTSVLIVFGLAVASLNSCNLSAGKKSETLGVKLAGASLVGLLVGGGWSFTSVKRVWAIREQWNDFGRSDSFLDVANMWPWFWMLICPLAFYGLLVGLRLSPNAERHFFFSDYLLKLWCLIIGITVFTWGVSYFDIAAIWHRRYIIGLLPLVCLAGAINWGNVILQIRWRHFQAMTLPIVVSGLIVLQGDLLVFVGGDLRAVRRQEEWRGSIKYLNQRLTPEDQVWLAAGLIESRWLDRPTSSDLTSDERAYLLFPVSGPYRVEQAVPMGSIGSARSATRILSWLETERSNGAKLWIIVRMARGPLQQRLAELRERIERERGGKVEFIPFRKLTLVRISR